MKITKLLSVALVAAVLGLAACSKSSDSNSTDANQTTLLTAAASFAASVNIFPTALPTSTNAYAYVAQDSLGAAVAGAGGSQFATVFGMVPLLIGNSAGTPISEISSSSSVILNAKALPTITGAGKAYTAFFTVDLTSTLGITTKSGGDSTLSVAAQVYQSADSYLLLVLKPVDGTKTSSTWVALLAASGKKDQSSGSLVGFSTSISTPATQFSWTRTGTTVTYTVPAFSSAITLTTTVAAGATGIYTVTAGDLKIVQAQIEITWTAAGTGNWSDPNQVLTGGQGGTSGTF